VKSREERAQGGWKILAGIGMVILVLLVLYGALEGINGHLPAQDRSGTPVIALLSVGVGALLGGVVRAFVDRYTVFEESQGMAVALKAEIEALLQIIHYREYVRLVTERISRLQDATDTLTRDDNVFNIRVSQEYFTVFHAVCPKIGLLGSLSTPVVRLYTVGKSLVEDLHYLAEIYERVRTEQGDLDRKELLNRSQAVADLFQTILVGGPQVVTALAAYAAHPWWEAFRPRG
jgi:hypothetical protein